MKKQIVVLGIVCVFSICLVSKMFAQSFTPYVIGSAGTYSTSANGSMSWTIGEVMTETYSTTNNFFTQGFHQPQVMPVSVLDYSLSQNILVYPNPVVDALLLDFSNTTGNYKIEIVDVLGNILHTEPIPIHLSKTTISFKEFSNGLYLLHVINTDTNRCATYKINKVE